MSARSALEALVGSMTVAELADRSGRSVEAIVGWAMGSGTSGTSRKSTKGDPETRSSSKAVNTRTKEGRVAYDESVLKTVRESPSPIGASKIRQQVGGTPLQVRASLDRLIESGAVAYQGRARATRYFTS